MTSDPHDQRMKWMVFWHFIQMPDIFMASKQAIDEMGYFKTYPWLEAAYICMASYHEEFTEMIPLEILCMQYRAVCEDMRVDQETQRLCITKFDKYYGTEPQGRALVQQTLEDAYRDYRTRKLSIDIQAPDSDEERQRSVASVNDVLSSNMFANLQTKNAFEDPKAKLQMAKRSSTHCEILDGLIDGAAAGDIIGWFAPSGGGKTTEAIQVHCRHIDASATSAYFSGEQPMEGDLSIRMYSVMTGNKRFIFENPDTVYPETYEKIQKKSQVWGHHGHFFDLTDEGVGAISSIDDLWRPIEAMVRDGNPPRVIILDWWGCFVTLLNAGLPPTRDGNEQKEREKRWILDLKKRCKSIGAWCLILHQIAGASAGKSSKHVASSHDAQGNKDLNNMMDYCVVTSKKDKSSGAVRIITDKARGKENREIRGVLDGARCRIRRDTDPDRALEGMTAEVETQAQSVQDVRSSFEDM